MKGYVIELAQLMGPAGEGESLEDGTFWTAGFSDYKGDGLHGDGPTQEDAIARLVDALKQHREWYPHEAGPPVRENWQDPRDGVTYRFLPVEVFDTEGSRK